MSSVLAGQMPPDNDGSKPSVLIVGGLGYIGRQLAHYIQTRKLASTLRIVDKVLPQLAHLSAEHTQSCSSASIFLQADASRQTAMDRIFSHSQVPNGAWDIVFNLGGETAWAQSAEIYKLRTTQLSVTLAQEASSRGVRAFVEVSTGMVYAPERKPRTEKDRLKPWLKLAQAKLDAERELSKIPNLNLVILRLAHVYGEFDRGFVAKALSLARVYQELGKELKWLWTEDLRINTVYIDDAVRALWRAAEWRRSKDSTFFQSEPTSPTTKRKLTLLGGRKDDSSSSTEDIGPSRATPVFNIVDHGHTSQGVLATAIARVFGIQTGFQGSLVSQFAKMNLDSVVDDLNDDNLDTWADLCERKSISQTPLSPYLEKELLKDTDFSLDGSLFEKTTGFVYDRERLDEEGIRSMIASYEVMGWWP